MADIKRRQTSLVKQNIEGIEEYFPPSYRQYNTIGNKNYV